MGNVYGLELNNIVLNTLLGLHFSTLGRHFC